MMHPPIVLASGSPRRKELLAALGLTFEVLPADIDEDSFTASSPSELVKILSLEKARVVAKERTPALIIAADTIVVLDNEILGKPKDLEENRTFLKRLSGQAHSVFTGHTLIYENQEVSHVEETRVFFKTLDDAELERYVATQDGLDKAGGYGIQGRGAPLITHVEGDYFTIVGMSVVNVVELARRLGVTLV